MASPQMLRPPFWNEKFVYCVVGQEGKVRCESKGLRYYDRLWLFQTCNALGLEYEALGRVSEHQQIEKESHLVALRVPKNWTFKPDRHVAFVNLCGLCNGWYGKKGYSEGSVFVGPDKALLRELPMCKLCYMLLIYGHSSIMEAEDSEGQKPISKRPRN